MKGSIPDDFIWGVTTAVYAIFKAIWGIDSFRRDRRATSVQANCNELVTCISLLPKSKKTKVIENAKIRPMLQVVDLFFGHFQISSKSPFT